MTAQTIRELFAKPVDRPIEGVIKADDERHLQVELDEYVVTREVSKGLGAFTDAYLHNPTANGVWISGFFGSGKSHLLKMLSLMLDGEKRVGEQDSRPVEILLPKVEDEIIRADLKKAAAIPARSLLFNIDQKFDGIGGTHEAPILEVFMKVLNELQGYYGNQGYVAQFEHDLNKRSQFEAFKQTYQRVNGRSWENDRDALATVTKRSFARAYAEQFGGSEDDAVKVINDAKDSYRLSIEGFAGRVKEYLDSQPPGFRLNFFVDEAGQFIGQERSRLLNLQTVVESLATATDGRAAVFITSQADLEGILGQVKFEQADDLSKIQGRFKTKLTLASADVQEVIQRRLLAKTPDEPEQLIAIYEQEKDNFTTLFRFGDGSIQLKGWGDCQSFCGLYPFHPYQLSLFQQAIQSLATHSIFEGRNMAVGERSMLSVFQEVAKAIKELPVGRLASFDQLYDGIRDVIRADKQQTMVTAQNQVGELELRILKALFLLKWVQGFKSTARNIAILLIQEPNFDIRAHEQAVKEALINLESQSYLQRSGEVYEFLTDKEKDVEQEIKRVEVSDSVVVKTLHGVVFDDVLRSNKIRFEDNGNDYPFAQKIDDGLIKGRDTDVAVNLVTPEHPNYGSEGILHSRNMGGTELMAILPAKDRLLDQIRNHLKTDLYIRQNSGGEDEALNAILAVRSRQNSARRQEITRQAEELLRTAALVVNGQTLSVGEGDPKTRFSKAYQELIRSAFPKLKMIRGNFSEATVAQVVREQDDLLEGSAIQLSEAEQEVLVDVERQQKLGERLSAEDLVRKFEARPYGWSNWATLSFIARLYRLGKLELREKELLSSVEVIEALTNSRRLGGVSVRKQEQFDTSTVNALKRFHQELFNVQSLGTDARSTCEAFRMAMAEEAQDLREIAAQAASYPFLAAVKPWAEKAEAMAKKDDGYLLNQLESFKDSWLDAEEDLLTPLKQFLNGNQKTVYDEVRAFELRYGDEFADLPADLVAPLRMLLESEKPYPGGLIPQAKSAIVELQKQLGERLAAAKAKALEEISEQEARLKATADFQRLEASKQEQVLAATAAAKTDVEAASQPGRALLRVSRYRAEEVPKQLQRLAALADPVDTPTAAPIKVVAASALKVNCPLSQITNSQELQQWLDALRASAQAELELGHRISL
ncbi:BREX system P-loop protein BrxC [Cyanobium sp. Cruz CV13-4-11]|uniref:BREX system P-loop protein BrxC n=1 Tax=unclassified Cyanobium TaxID=2627006 RepID=UPI0020CEA04B|nr:MULTISPECIES: BREX system P-loop protein BrxC [unclassified Cyanobium]MCP9899302.1 BREX system P-loop protein BrxC [Cyanobium sp. Cruz CV11-17]MCP9917953.1 BREX system P-loop protein BrxC [Cyanobium sp. Cruz CV13-4-11]